MMDKTVSETREELREIFGDDCDLFTDCQIMDYQIGIIDLEVLDEIIEDQLQYTGRSFV